MTLEARIGATTGSRRVSVHLEVQPGQILAVLGPSGAGKTTLVKAIAGLHRVDTGRVTLSEQIWFDSEQRIDLAPERRRFAVLFQEDRLFPHLTASENVSFGLRARGVPRHAATRTSHEWLERLGVGDLAERHPSQISGGESRRVAIARALAARPQAIALDEPTTALDVETRQNVRAELRRHLLEAGVPAIVVTHDHMDAAILAERIMVIEDGASTQEGTLIELTARPRSEWVARLAGTNLWPGRASGTTVDLDTGPGELTIAEAMFGPVLVSLPPKAVTLSRSRPAGSARNVFQGRVISLDPIGDRIRVTVDADPTVIAEVTAGAVVDLDLGSDRPIWVSIKATELEVYPR